MSSLSRAEKQVLGLIVAGKTNRLMAAELDLSVRTIEDRRARLMHKLGVRSRAELIELVTANGLASDGEGARLRPDRPGRRNAYRPASAASAGRRTSIHCCVRSAPMCTSTGDWFLVKFEMPVSYTVILLSPTVQAAR